MQSIGSYRYQSPVCSSIVKSQNKIIQTHWKFSFLSRLPLLNLQSTQKSAEQELEPDRSSTKQSGLGGEHCCISSTRIFIDYSVSAFYPIVRLYVRVCLQRTVRGISARLKSHLGAAAWISGPKRSNGGHTCKGKVEPREWYVNVQNILDLDVWQQK